MYETKNMYVLGRTITCEKADMSQVASVDLLDPRPNLFTAMCLSRSLKALDVSGNVRSNQAIGAVRTTAMSPSCTKLLSDCLSELVSSYHKEEPSGYDS